MALTQVSQAGAKDEAINEAKIQISNAGTNGQYLQKQSGNAGGLTWATVDTSTLMPLAGGTFTGDVTFDNQSDAGKDIIWDESDDALEFADDTKAVFGTGSDLTLQHTSGHSRITHGGAGNLIVEVTTTDSDLYLRAEDKVHIQPHNGNDGVICNAQGSTDLYNNNVKKLSTGAEGITVFSTAPYVKYDADSYDCYSGAANANNNLANGSAAGNLVLRGETGVAISGDNGTSTKLKVSGSGGELVGSWTGAGKVLQVVTTVKQDAWSEDLSNASYSAVVSGLTVAITPASASNKVLIMASVAVSQEHGDRVGVSITKGGSTFAGAKGTGVSNRVGVGFTSGVSSTTQAGSVPVMYLDSPSSTSELTYGIKIMQGSGSTSEVMVNQQATGDSDEANRFRYVSTITAMEIAG